MKIMTLYKYTIFKSSKISQNYAYKWFCKTGFLQCFVRFSSSFLQTRLYPIWQHLRMHTNPFSYATLLNISTSQVTRTDRPKVLPPIVSIRMSGKIHLDVPRLSVRHWAIHHKKVLPHISPPPSLCDKGPFRTPQGRARVFFPLDSSFSTT